MVRGMKLVDLTGKTFGRLTAIRRAENGKSGRAQWLCRCSCGAEKVAASYALQSGNTSSCGCVRSDAMKRMAAERWKDCVYSANRDKYKGWHHMVSRCHNEDDKQFAAYGAKGVTVCDAWRTFAGFIEWAKDKPAGTTLDRIDPSGPYSPENCRWADHLPQQTNRRRHVWIEHQGERLTATQLARKLGVPHWKIYNGIQYRGDPFWYVK